MGAHKSSSSSLEYGRKLLNSGFEGARSGREAFLHGRPLTPFLSESARAAWKPAALAACIAIVGGCPGSRHRSVSRMVAYGFLGGAIGFGTALAWKSRHLTASVTDGAWRNIGRVRDEHWLEKHPIDYA